MKYSLSRRPLLLPISAATVAAAALALWFMRGTSKDLSMRVPGTDNAPGIGTNSSANPVLTGKVITPGATPPEATRFPGDWPQFRGPALSGIAAAEPSLKRSWSAGEPRELWSVPLGDGYAGAAVSKGRVYVIDYDAEKKQDALRCFSLADGAEIWRFEYPVRVKRNHGMSRTVPAVFADSVVAIGPKCHVACVDASSGKLRWGMDLVQEYGTTVPQWYAGQCPLVIDGTLILAPGGKDALVMAVDLSSGKPLWKTPNPRGWNMTHTSVTPLTVAGQRMLIYCADKGVVGVSAEDGKLLWETMDWKISIATVASPVVVGEGLVFFSGGYNAGSLMLRIEKQDGAFRAVTVFRLPPETFGATQQTPILYNGHIYGARPDGRFVCLTLEGKIAWASASSQQFGLGSYVLGDGMIYALNDSGLLRLIEATPARYTLLSQAQVLKGRESWGPMALAGGCLLARDLTRMVCLQAGR